MLAALNKVYVTKDIRAIVFPFTLLSPGSFFIFISIITIVIILYLVQTIMQVMPNLFLKGRQEQWQKKKITLKKPHKCNY